MRKNKWSWFFLIIVALFIYLTCFIEQHNGLAGGIEFEVDGTKYWVNRYADVNRQGRVASSSLFVSLRSERKGASTEYNSQRGTTIVRMNIDGKRVVAKTDTLYFFQDGKILFEKRYQELGIDAQKLNGHCPTEMLEHLRPILETLIREHVPPQVTEMEE